MIYVWILAVLIAFSAGISPTDCTGGNVCYGIPTDCLSNGDCHMVAQFDRYQNLDIHVHNFTEPDEYIALSSFNSANNVNEYMICIPHLQKRLRAVARPGEAIRITESFMAQYIRQSDNNRMVCTFLSTEIPPAFKNQRIFASEGQFTNDLVISPGYELHLLSPEEVYIHQISALADEDDGVLTVEEKKLSSDLAEKLRRINEGQDDMPFMGEKETNSDEESDTVLDDILNSGKKFSTRRRQERKRLDKQNKDQGDIDEDPDTNHRQNTKKRSFHRIEDDDNDKSNKGRGRGQKRSREESDEEDFYDEDNGTTKLDNLHILGAIYIFFFLHF